MSLTHQVISLPTRTPQELILHAAQGGALQQRMPNLRHAVSVRGNTLSAAEAFTTASFPEHNGVYVSGPTTEKGSKWLVAFFKNARDAQTVLTALERQSAHFSNASLFSVKQMRSAPFVELQAAAIV
ncbi:MAG: hypothetical protein WC043_08265 [Pseudobdellovibrionaceae bacterium]